MDIARKPGDSVSGAQSGIEYKWLVAIAVIFGLFMAVLDATVVNIALSKLQAVFGVTLDTIQWVVTAYTLAQTVSIPIFGYLADRFGIKWTYIASLALFTVASALCGLAWNASSMILFRILQGLGGGALMPLGIAQIFAVFPPKERGTASTVFGIPVLLAPALGPTLGGYLIQYADWRLIFYINVPVGIIGVIACWLILRVGYVNPRAKLDIPGLVLSTMSFASLVYGVGEAASKGWNSSVVLGFSALGAICFVALILVELRTAEPLLDFRLFRSWSWIGANFITWITAFALYGALFLVPVFLQSLRGLSALQSGLALLPAGLATIVALPLSGIVSNRFGPKWSIVIGLSILIVASYLLSRITLSTPVFVLQLWMIARSIGLGFSAQPANTIALSSIPPQQLSRSSSFFNVLRQVASAFTTSFLATYVSGASKPHYAHLAEQVTPMSPLGMYISNVVAGAAARGANVLQARAQVMQMIVGQLRRQAAVMAYKDAFLLIAGITVVALVFAFFLSNPRGGSSAVVME